MKKLLLPLLCFLLLAWVSSTGARMTTMIVGGSTPALSDYCAACPDDTNNADLICEDYEGAGERCVAGLAWTDAIEDQGSISPDTGMDADWDCLDLGDEVVEIVTDTTWDDLTYTWADFGAESEVYVKFWVVWQAEDCPPATLCSHRIMGLFTTSATADARMWVNVREEANDTYALSFRCDTTDGTATTVNLNQQYEIALHWVSGGTSTIELDGVSKCSDASSAAADVRFITLGKSANSSAATTYTVEFAGVTIDDDTEPSDCTE